MINRPQTAFLSVTALMVVTAVLGSDARAQSASTAPAQSYTSFLLGLPAARSGISLMQRYKTLERSLIILKNIPLPGPRTIGQISSLYNQLTKVYSNLQKNIKALVVSRERSKGSIRPSNSRRSHCYPRVRSHRLKG